MGFIVENPSCVYSAEVVVGIPSYKEGDAIGHVAKVADEGLTAFFSDKHCAIINVDNNSPDDTRDAFLSTPTKNPKIYISTEPGVKGKGNNIRNLFEATVALGAKAAVMVDADLRSITPAWIQHLAEPLFAGFNYVTPIYVRHKYDGSITNHIAYPMTRTLYGLRVRQPIGGDFGFSGRMARCFLSEKLWNTKTANFGIDIWMTTIAIARRFKVCQTFLGAPKTHRAKDPAADLGPMFRQVVQTIFETMIDFEYLWKDTDLSLPSSIFGFGLGVVDMPPPVEVNTQALHDSFKGGLDKYGGLWEQILPADEFEAVMALKDEKKDSFYYHSDLWARILFNFAIAYRNGQIAPVDVVEALIPFYHSRVLSFYNKTIDKDTKETEEYLENITRVFEMEKPYLIQRWDEDHAKLRNLFVC